MTIPKTVAAQNQLGMPKDDARHVVEVVGHTTGKCPERLRLLRLHQLFLERLCLFPAFHRKPLGADQKMAETGDKQGEQQGHEGIGQSATREVGKHIGFD